MCDSACFASENQGLMLALWRKFCGSEREKQNHIYQSDLSPPTAVQSMKQMSQVLIRLETESNGNSHSAKMTRSAGSPVYSLGDSCIKCVQFAGHKLVFRMGWLGGSFPALKPAARKLGGALGW